MKDTPSRPPAPPPSTDRASDTARGALEVTGNPPADAPGSTRQTTVPGAPVLPAHEGDALPTIGGYTVVRKLGEGGMGAVYLAEDAKLRRKVAIKIMRPELAGNKLDRERFEREAPAAAAVEHDNIVPILHVGEAADGTPYIAMPFLQGETLDARLKRDPVASLGLVLKVAREVADGLTAAHTRALVHRDIKPGNIWLEGDPTSTEPAQQVRRCKILDFGLARSVNRDAQVTASGAILGTPAYMSPEQARGERSDHRADLFSLGATLYRTATGRLPFDGPTPMAVLIALTTETQLSVSVLAPNLPQALADLIDRLMCKDPAARPQSAAEVSATVRQIVQELKAKRTAATPTVRSSAPPPVPQDLLDGAAPAEASSSRPVELVDDETTESEAPPHGRRVWIIAAAVGVFALLLLAVWIVGTTGSRKPDPDGTKTETPPVREKPGNGPPGKSEPPKQTVTPKDAPTDYAAERKAAEFVLACGGRFRVNGAEDDYKQGKNLPSEPFRLRWVDVNSSNQVTDTTLAVFKECQHLEKLDLSGTATGDVGLSHFSGCKRLEKLELRDTPVGDTGLDTIKQFTRLRDLDLRGARVSESGVIELTEALPECIIHWNGGVIDPWAGPNFDFMAAKFVLDVGGTVRVNGAGTNIKEIKDLPNGPFRLTAVYLSGPVNEAHLSVFQNCRNLKTLYLIDTQISAQGLTHFKGCKNLAELHISGTELNDVGLQQIARFTKLTDLSIKGTKIARGDVLELAKALPKCRIEWDDGAVEPKK
jgi:serine/threonine protein kinase